MDTRLKERASWMKMRWGLDSLMIAGRPPWSVRLLVFSERRVTMEAAASPSSLGRGALLNVLGRSHASLHRERLLP